MLLLTHVRLREIHTHGWTIAAPASWLPALAERLPQLEAAAARVHGGAPKVIHLAELGK